MSDQLIAVDPVDEFLEHIGVKGMKWGVSKGKGSKVFNRAVKKAQKLDATSAKLTTKGAKLQYKGSQKGDFKKMGKGMKLSYKGVKMNEKRVKWEAKMAKHLTAVKVSELDMEHKENGKKYFHLLLGDSDALKVKA